MDLSPINFVLVADGGYIMQLSVTMTSILTTTMPGRSVRFFIFASDARKSDILRLMEIKRLRGCEVIIVDMSEYKHYFLDLTANSFALKYITIATYYRLLMLSILPEDVDKCFYVDGDMVIDADLSKIYDDLGDNCLAKVVVDVHSMQNRHELLSHLYQLKDFAPFSNTPMKNPYFNAGFFLLNINLTKELKLFEEAMNFLKRVPNPPYADQDTLNAIIGQHHGDIIEYLNPEYNVFCDIDYNVPYDDAFYDSNTIRRAFGHPKIYHFAGGNKPWNSLHIRHYREKWLYYHARSPFWEADIPMNKQPRKRYNYPFIIAEKTIAKKKVRLFGVIPLLKIKYRPNGDYFYLFDVIPIGKTIKNDTTKVFHLFFLIPILWIKSQQNTEWVRNPE